MYDPNIQDFYQRVSRIQRARAAGLGFGAIGTLGRSHYFRKPKTRSFGFVMPLFVVLMGVFGLKGTIHYSVGAQTYDTRVAELAQSEGVDRFGAVIMMVDPVTLWVSETLRAKLAG
jgi:hypothetical protein